MAADLSSVRRLNRDTERLREVLRQNRQNSSVRELDETARGELVSCLEQVSFFLRKVTVYQTTNAPLALTAELLTRRAFFELLEISETGPVLGRMAAKATLLVLPANVWLYLHAMETMADLSSGKGPLTSIAQEEGLRMNQLHLKEEPDPILVKVAKAGCPLKGVSKRPRLNSKGEESLGVHQTPATLCERACEMLFLEQLGFGRRETGMVLGLGKNTVDDRIGDCKTKENELREAALQSATKPGLAPMKQGRTHG